MHSMLSARVTLRMLGSIHTNRDCFTLKKPTFPQHALLERLQDTWMGAIQNEKHWKGDEKGQTGTKGRSYGRIREGGRRGRKEGNTI